MGFKELLIAFAFLFAPYCMLFASHAAGWATVLQMRSTLSKMNMEQQGLPMMLHGVIFGAPLLVWVMTRIVARTWSAPWHWYEVLGMAIIAVAVVKVSIPIWHKADLPEAPQFVTAAKWLIPIQLGLAFAILARFFVFAENQSAGFALEVALCMVAYTFLCTHMHVAWYAQFEAWPDGKNFYPRRPWLYTETWTQWGGAIFLCALGWARIRYHWW